MSTASQRTSFRGSFRGAAHRVTRSALAAAALLGAFAAAQAQPARDGVGHLSVTELKRGYLACHRASMRRALAAGESMQCSMVYEELKQRAFGGDFERVLAWTHTQLPRTDDTVDAASVDTSSCPVDL